MRLDQIDLVCADVAKSLAFYRLLGVEIPEDKVWGAASGPHHCVVMSPSDAAHRSAGPEL